LLGELRAIEALDLLIAHLDATNGFHSSSMVFQPAIIGVRQMGKAAVPKLTLALKENPKPSIRMAAAYCLTDIGGEAAMHALSQAQEDESNRCVTNFIRVSLNTFRYQSKNGIAFDNDAPQANGEARGRWLLAFQCVE
jgi:HEAT repeat protein